MKIYNYIIILLILTVSGACSGDENSVATTNTQELTLSSVVNEAPTVETKLSADDFFEDGFGIDISIWATNNASEQKFVYYYGSDGIFRGNPGYYFTLDDNYIDSLSAVWPITDIRDQPFITDQREFENFRKADWMIAKTSERGIMPTDKPVPLNFTRENTKLEFELAGQNTEGLDIESLLIELHSGGSPVAYWAYCGNINGHAELILEKGTQLTSPDQYLIGTMKVAGNTENYTIIFPQTDITLEAGKRYLVTLTPEGYFMSAYISIGGWDQGDDGIGIPFQQPQPDINGNFLINEPLQLITMSYLVRHYTDGTTFNWPSRTYILADDLDAKMTDDYASKYIQMPKSKFTGKVVNNGSIVPVDTIYYGSGKALPLFDINN